jgi:hypothetical protein
MWKQSLLDLPNKQRVFKDTLHYVITYEVAIKKNVAQKMEIERSCEKTAPACKTIQLHNPDHNPWQGCSGLPSQKYQP